MATVNWTGAGLASGTVLDNTNLNATGNGTGTLVFQALSGGATRTTIQEANGDGVEITGPAGSLARLDTAAIAGGAECMAVQFIYKAPATPTTAHHYLAVGRNANATPASTSHIRHTITTNIIEFCNGADAVVTGGASPALTAGHFYKIDMAVIRNTTTTPSTTNGRIIGRAISLSNANWVSSGVSEFFIDTGYTVNVTTDMTDRFRLHKATTANAVGTFRVLNLFWRDLNAPNTSTVKANAITNFVQTSAPTVSTTGTGGGYPIFNVATAAAGGDLTYTITQTAGTVHAPEATAVEGVWTVDQDTSSATTYEVTVDEAGAGSVTTTHVVPQASTAASGQYRERVQIGGVLV